MSLEISEDAIWARIGRLTVENELLRERLAQLESAANDKPTTAEDTHADS